MRGGETLQGATTLGFALLGLLAREELSGYDLVRRLRRPVGYFWQARHSQVYPQLLRLEARGLVTHRVVEQRDRPDKKVYALTAVGREALRAWVTSELDESPVRDELVLRAFCSWLAEPQAVAALFREHERRHAARLARYREIEAEMGRGPDGAAPPVGTREFADYAALRRGLGRQQEAAAWCRWMAEQAEAAAPAGAEQGEATASP